MDLSIPLRSSRDDLQGALSRDYLRRLLLLQGKM